MTVQPDDADTQRSPPAPGQDVGPLELVVLGEHVGVTVAELLKQPGGALDVGEQERHRPDRQLSHRDASCHAR